MEGRCTCGATRFSLNRAPMFVFACHCTWCQRETGSAFAVVALIERSELVLRDGSIEVVVVPSPSGKGQAIRRCPVCKVALWSHFGGADPDLTFVRVGTLEDPGSLQPSVHCYTSTKLDWVVLDDHVPAEPDGFDDEDYWPAESLERKRAMKVAREHRRDGEAGQGRQPA